jgi:hypothetical protein
MFIKRTGAARNVLAGVLTSPILHGVRVADQTPANLVAIPDNKEAV